MVFTSSIFIFVFFPAVCILYLLSILTKKISVQNFVLLLCSLFFYAWGGIKYLILLCVSIIVNYVLGIRLGKCKKNKKIVMTFGVVWNIGILFWFKYMTAIVPSLNIALPIGISFFTFQILSYLFDVYYKTSPVQKNILKLALYIMLFPQLIAGPIVRYNDVKNEISSRKTTFLMLHDGIMYFMMGFIKKIFLANTMGLMADEAFATCEWLNTSFAWLGIISYAMQIYLDFSAYSDMAIGLGLIFGFHFPKNFDYPYISQSVGEFWKRWHISLSSWFKDYVYIPLGGNRKGKVRTYINLFLVFLFTGIWHGAAWNFVFWGMYNGIILIAERAFLKKYIDRLPKILRHLYALFFVLIGLAIFRAESLYDIFLYIKTLLCFDFTNYGTFNLMELIDKEYITMFIISIVICMPVVKIIMNKAKEQEFLAVIFDIVVVCLFLLAVLYMVGADFNPFIYFRF